MKVALATFVKTPELSPVKTRLGARIGPENARRFYTLSLNSVSALMSEARRKHNNLEVFWAVAEPEAEQNEHWLSFPTICQGQGNLGQRLDHVYNCLSADYDAVIFLGADSPQLSQALIARTICLLQVSSIVLGPAVDGGFYLFAGRIRLGPTFWNSVPYSVPETMEKLIGQLPEGIKPALLPPRQDVDRWEDLPLIIPDLRRSRRPAAHELADWITALLSSVNVAP